MLKRSNMWKWQREVKGSEDFNCQHKEAYVKSMSFWECSVDFFGSSEKPVHRRKFRVAYFLNHRSEAGWRALGVAISLPGLEQESSEVDYR